MEGGCEVYILHYHASCISNVMPDRLIKAPKIFYILFEFLFT